MRRSPVAGISAVSALAFVLGCGSLDRARPSTRPDILLVTIDTFRADRVGVGIAPAIDRLAESAIRFTNARTAVPLTLPSHATILTGLLPPAHGVRENGVGVLGDAHPTIARLLRDAGYATAAFVGAFVLDRRFGLAQGFDTYDDQIPRNPDAAERLEAERPASAVVDRALAWLANDQRQPTNDERPTGQRPFFVWMHLYDPHAPYTPPPEFRARTTNPYDGEIAYADAQLARVLAWLRTRGLADRTLTIVAGDHGEGLGDHGERTHGMLLYESTLRVPLIVAAPGEHPARRDEPVSLADIAPTVLHAAHVPIPQHMKGRDLLADVRLKEDAADFARTYSETEYPRVAGWSPLQALTDGRWKTIRAGGATEVYDLQNDAQEQHDVAAAQPAMAAAMARRIDAIHSSGSTAARSISPDAAERLRALGYVASSTQSSPAAVAANPALNIHTWNAFEEALNALDADPAGAIPRLNALASRNPDALVFQTTYAAALKQAGRLGDAVAAYRRAAERWPADATVLHDLASAARAAAAHASGAAGRALRDEAVRADQAAVALAPDNALAHNGLGLLAVDAGRARDAAAEFERASALDPNNASYWTNLGNARRALHEAAAAERAYRRALEIDPQWADAANGLGVLLVEAHRAGEAVQWFERAVQAAPDLTEAQLNLGIALQESGNRSRAAEQYRRVLAARGASREKSAAAKLLASLGASW